MADMAPEASGCHSGRRIDVFALASLMGAILFALAAPSAGQEIKIGLALGPTSFDPHYHAHAASFTTQRHVFEPLITRAPDSTLQPTLARKWAPLPEGDGWEFRLDPAARFQDGAPVTANDVAASLRRALTIPNSPARWTPFLGDITRVEIIDERTIRLRGDGPAPLIPGNITALMIIPARIAVTATTADFNEGRATIGSGPYRLRRYVAGTALDFTADGGWWRAGRDGAEPWSRVEMRVVSNDSSRVAALMARDLDLIEAVPPADAARLAARPDMRLAQATHGRIVYLALDQQAAVPAGLTDRRGGRPARNPLADVRVRRALSLAIDRAAIVARVMDGYATVSDQIQPPGAPANDPTLPPPVHDLAEARRLLAEAGWAEGFRLVLGGPNNRLVNDERILQAVAQMWERLGVSVEVQAQPMAVYLPRFTAGGYPSALASWIIPSEDPNSFFSAILATRNPGRGRGVYNPSSYSNPVLDQLLDQALATIDPPTRHAVWRRATRLALHEDVAVLPLHHQIGLWAMRRDLSYVARSDEATYAMGVRPVTPP
jgi:peptide/nickel transport system substrate-binding protein